MPMNLEFDEKVFEEEYESNTHAENKALAKEAAKFMFKMLNGKPEFKDVLLSLPGVFDNNQNMN